MQTEEKTVDLNSQTLQSCAEYIFRQLGFQKVVRIRDVAQHFEVSPSRLYRAIAFGELTQLGKGCVDRKSLKEWFCKHPTYLAHINY